MSTTLCDLIQSLLHGWPDDLQRRVPMLSAMAITRSGPHRSIRGQLYWDGVEIPDIAERVRSVYQEPLLWAIANQTGAVWELDLQLIDALGLHYILVEHTGNNPLEPSEDDEITVWELHREEPVQLKPPFSLLHQAGWHAIRPFRAFIEEHYHQLDPFIQQLRSELAFMPL